MDILEQVRQWVATFPGWDALPQIDCIGTIPGQVGLFPKGVELLGRMEDVLGNVKQFCRYGFSLQQVCAEGEGAAPMLQFQQWVTRQSEAGLAPCLGADTRWRAEAGQLIGSKGAGTMLYEVKLTAEFTKMNE